MMMHDSATLKLGEGAMHGHGERDWKPKSGDADHDFTNCISRLFILGMDPVFEDFDSHATCHALLVTQGNHVETLLQTQAEHA